MKGILNEYIEDQRDELVTSMIENMDKKEYDEAMKDAGKNTKGKMKANWHDGNEEMRFAGFCLVGITAILVGFFAAGIFLMIIGG